jgi:hypothetical protein
VTKHWKIFFYALLVLLALWRAYDLRWLSDDAFITFRYVENINNGLGAVYNPGERVEAYSHPLWLAVLSVGKTCGIEPETLSVILGLTAYAGILSIMFLWFPKSWPVGAILLGINYDFAVWATGGLETMAFTLAILSAAYITLRMDRPILLGSMLTAATLLRPDGIVFYAAFFFWSLVEHKTSWKMLMPGVVILLHELWRFSYYGLWLPIPFYAKSAYMSYWSQGFTYLRTFVEASPWLCGGSLILAIAGMFGKHRREVAFLSSLTFLYLFVFVVRVGGDFMFARFLIPILPLVCVMAEIGALQIKSFWWIVVVWMVCTVGLDGNRRAAVFAEGLVTKDGISDERAYYTTTANAIEMQRFIGLGLRPYFENQKSTVLLRGQCALGYYAKFYRCVEGAGLTDPTIAQRKIGVRGRIGHEKGIGLEDAKRMGVNFVFMRTLDPKAPRVGFDVGGKTVAAEVIVPDTVALNAWNLHKVRESKP